MAGPSQAIRLLRRTSMARTVCFDHAVAQAAPAGMHRANHGAAVHRTAAPAGNPPSSPRTPHRVAGDAGIRLRQASGMPGIGHDRAMHLVEPHRLARQQRGQQLAVARHGQRSIADMAAEVEAVIWCGR